MIKNTPIPVAVFTIPFMVSNNVAAFPTRPDTSSANPFWAMRAVWEVMDRKSRRQVPVTRVATPMIKESDPRINMHISITNCRSFICNMFIITSSIQGDSSEINAYLLMSEASSVLGNIQNEPFFDLTNSLQSFNSTSGCILLER